MSDVADRARGPGFTLIEVMVVVIVIGVFAGLAAPLLGERRAGAELAQAARSLAQAAQFARQEAARTGADVHWVLGREAPNAWALESPDPEAPDGARLAVRRGGFGAGTLPEGLAFVGVEVIADDAAGLGDEVLFRGLGGATPAAVRIAGEAGERTVRVHASGRATIEPVASGPPAGRVDLDLGS